MHGAKGLEWDSVAVVELNEGDFPGGTKSKLGWEKAKAATKTAAKPAPAKKVPAKKAATPTAVVANKAPAKKAAAKKATPVKTKKA